MPGSSARSRARRRPRRTGWPAIATGANTLICAPTGSGKTLAAFLWGIDRLAREPERLGSGVRLVYVSPLKALSYDVERNLRAPLAGVGADVSVGLRTGDTPQKDRQAMLRQPPDILITTPESLYLMMTSRAREILTDVEALIVDEIHAVAPTKRGAHMALTVERLERHVRVEANEGEGREEPLQRIGLSATQRPLERIAQFLVGPGRECSIVDAGVRKEMDLEIVVPVEDMADPGSRIPPAPTNGDGEVELPGPSPTDIQMPGDTQASNSIWPAIYPQLLKLVREHTSTIIFVNNRRGSERLAKRLNEMNAEQLFEAEQAEEGEQGAGNEQVDAAEVRRDHQGRRRRSPRFRSIAIPRSPAPTMGRSRARSGRSSRSCSSPGSFPASSPPRRWSSGSTWGPSTW